MLGLILFMALVAVISKDGLRVTVNGQTYSFKVDVSHVD